MNRYHKARRLVAATAACLGATAVAGLAGSAPALAVPTCGTNWASGSSLQGNAQLKVWFEGFKTHFGSCGSAPKQTYDKTSSEFGLGEFGNLTGKLELKDDESVTEGGTAPAGVLDGWVGSDDAPTAGQIGDASRATPAASPIEITIPVAQAPVAVLLSLPHGCELEVVKAGSPIRVNIENVVLDELWQGKYAKWNEFLAKVSLTNATFTAANCEQPIAQEVRSVGSGTSYAFKNYLAQVDPAEWNEFATDYPFWPSKTAETEFKGKPNKSGGNLAQHTAENPGSVGYANTADAGTLFGCLSATGCEAGKVAFNGEAVSTTDGGSEAHQILWAKIQNNGVGTSGAGYAGPQTSAAGATLATEFSGNCATEKITPSEYGAPHSPEDSWNQVLASDPDATADLSGNFYPICALTYDLAWKHYKEANLKTDYEKAAEETNYENIEATVKAYLTYVTSSATGEGQAAIASYFYQKLPSGIQAKAAAAVAAISAN